MPKRFDAHKYNDDQIREALTHPINRYAVMTHYQKDEWWLHDNPNIVIQWWIEHGGAVEFAKRRKEYELENSTEEVGGETEFPYTPS